MNACDNPTYCDDRSDNDGDHDDDDDDDDVDEAVAVRCYVCTLSTSSHCSDSVFTPSSISVSKHCDQCQVVLSCPLSTLLGRVALVAQRLIVVKLSRE